MSSMFDETSVPAKAKFEKGEKVFCYHGSVPYPAKCLDWKIEEEVLYYQIHYIGWSKKWDTWVTESRLLKYTDENLEKQKDLNIGVKPSTQKKKASNRRSDGVHSGGKQGEGESSHIALSPSASLPPSSPSGPSSPSSSRAETFSSPDKTSAVTRKRKTRVGYSYEVEQQPTPKAVYNIKIPDQIKTRLVEDWDLICRQRKLVDLPANTCVDQILDAYVEQKPKDSITLEIARGICSYFNVMLPTQLLYKWEKPQHIELLEAHPNVPMSRLYGAVHLFRLCVRIGNALSYTQLEERSVTFLTNKINDFLRFLIDESSSALTVQEYHVAAPEYHRKAA